MSVEKILVVSFATVCLTLTVWVLFTRAWFDGFRHRRALRKVVARRGGEIVSEKPFVADIRIGSGLVRATLKTRQPLGHGVDYETSHFRAWLPGPAPSFWVSPKGSFSKVVKEGRTGDRLFDYDFRVDTNDMSGTLHVLTERARRLCIQLGSTFKLRESWLPLRDLEVTSDGESIRVARSAGGFKRVRSVELVVDLVDELTKNLDPANARADEGQ